MENIILKEVIECYQKEKLEINKYIKLIQELDSDTSKLELILNKIEKNSKNPLQNHTKI